MTDAFRDDASDRAIIAVVERDPHVRMLERHLLESAGYGVEFCSDGATALERIRDLLPPIVITELLVPRLDGLSLCRSLKSDPRTRDIPILVFSVLLSHQRAIEAGADAFLRKPIDDRRFIQAVERLLAKEDRERGAEHGTHHHGRRGDR